MYLLSFIASTYSTRYYSTTYYLLYIMLQKIIRLQSATTMSICSIVLYLLFTQGLCVVLEFHQHSAAKKLTRKIQQVGVIE